jgi:hypothetical protein
MAYPTKPTGNDIIPEYDFADGGTVGTISQGEYELGYEDFVTPVSGSVLGDKPLAEDFNLLMRQATMNARYAYEKAAMFEDYKRISYYGTTGTSLQTYITATGSNKAALVIDTTVTITSSISVPANIHIICTENGVFNISAGQTLTINGQFKAPLNQCFTGSGTVSFGQYMTQSYPEWFGYSGIVDDAPYIQKAINCLDHGIVTLSQSVYYLNTQIVCKTGVSICGVNTPTRNETNVPTIYVTYGSALPNSIAILLTDSVKISNINFTYPNQVSGTGITPPTVYGWTIGTDGTTTDDVELYNIFGLNPYKFMYLDNAGRVRLSNIKGQPIHTGIYMDRVYDEPIMNDVHFWTFYSTDISGVYGWMLDNAIAFDFGRVDGLKSTNIFAYGYNTIVKTSNKGYGSFWGSISNIDGDIFHTMFDIQTIANGKFSNISAYAADQQYSFLRTGSTVVGKALFSNVFIDDQTSVPIVISSTNGSFHFSNMAISNKWDSEVKFINESSAEVFVNSSNVSLIGGPGIVNGIHMPYLETDITASLTDFDMTNWTLGTPDAWTFLSGSNANVTQITDGIRLKLNNTNNSLHYVLPDVFKDRRKLYMLEFDYLPNDTTTDLTFRFFVKLQNDTGTKVAIDYSSAGGYAFVPKPLGETTKVRLPFMFAEDDDTQYQGILLEWQSYSYTTSNSIDITNIKMYEQKVESTTNSQLETLYKRIIDDSFGWYSPTVNGYLTGSKTHDFGTIGNGATATTTLTVTGARVGATVLVGLPTAAQVGFVWILGFVATDDTVSLMMHNLTGGNFSPGSATYKVMVLNL